MANWLAVADAGLPAAEGAGRPTSAGCPARPRRGPPVPESDYGQAAEHYTSALALARRSGWMGGEAASHGASAWCMPSWASSKRPPTATLRDRP